MNDTQLIPMINVVFLLLIFFMVAGQLSAADALVVTPPASRQALAQPRDGTTLLLDAQGALALDNQPVVLEGLDALLQARARTQPASLILKVDAATTAQTLDPVLQAIHRAGISQLTLLTARP